ncbi:hypothetical protein AT1219_10427 [Vibrio alginolyticus]
MKGVCVERKSENPILSCIVVTQIEVLLLDTLNAGKVLRQAFSHTKLL